MAIHWVTTVTINRPIEDVWAVFLDLFNVPSLPGSSFSVRPTTPGPMGLGSKLRARRVMLGFETVLIQTITEWDPPHAVAATMAGRPFRSALDRWTLEPVAGGVKMTETLDIELAPALKLLWPFIGPFQYRQRQRQVHAIKTRLESLAPTVEA
ncbi:MAG: SRPBCC family protein [Candidatus Limnocylindrales bacterium]